MAGLIDVINKFFKSYLNYLVIIIIAILFILVAYYFYNKHSASQTKFSDVANADRNNTITIFLFHVDWCPHCKKALPDWNSFVSNYDKKEINGYQIECIDVDCTNETSDVTNAIEKYNIESYPTIKMLKNNQVIEFDSKITETTLEQFVNTMANQK
jgi:thiol-disulfide isomerase/thioredoxin